MMEALKAPLSGGEADIVEKAGHLGNVGPLASPWAEVPRAGSVNTLPAPQRHCLQWPGHAPPLCAGVHRGASARMALLYLHGLLLLTVNLAPRRGSPCVSTRRAWTACEHTWRIDTDLSEGPPGAGQPRTAVPPKGPGSADACRDQAHAATIRATQNSVPISWVSRKSRHEAHCRSERQGFQGKAVQT